MVEQKQEDNPAASGGEGDQPNQPEPIKAEAKIEIKDGKVLVDDKLYVAEHHLIATKKSLEGRMEQAQTAHNTAINSTRLELSAAQTQIAKLGAKLKETEEASKSGSASTEDVGKVKQELEASKASMELLTAEAAKALDYRRALLVVQYGVAADTIKDKTVAQLDAFEEAIKAVSTARGGVGAYAVGGGGGEAAPQTNMERAAKLLDATPVRGTRTAEVSK